MSYGVVTAYRLVIEGLGIEAVTDPAMERLSPDLSRRRVVGLLRDGLSIDEQCDIANAMVEASGMTVSIVDRQEDSVWTLWLAGQPTARTYLTADATDTTTSLTVASNTNISTNDVLHIGTEALLVAGTSGSTTVDVTGGRAWWDTIAQYHYTDDGADLSLPVVTVTRPITLEGRRAYLYRYADGDSLQGSGTLIWRGTVSTDARLEDDGCTWTLTIDPITTLLKQPISGDTDAPVTLRGAYYPKETVARWNIHEMTSYELVDTDRRGEFSVVGHFETQEDWCAAIQLVLRTTMLAATADNTLVDISAYESTGAGFGLVRRAFNSNSYTDTDGVFVLPTTGGWQLTWTTDATNPAHLVLGAAAENALIDGGLPGGVLGAILEPDYDALAGLAPSANTLLSTSTLRGGMPRALWGTNWRGEPADPDLSVWDLFVSTATTAMTSIDIAWADGGDPSDFTGGVTANATRGSLRFQPDGADTGVRYSYPGRDVEIRPRRNIASGTLADFRDGLVALAPQLANAGGCPFVTTSDLASWTTVVDEAAGGRPFTSRNYQTAGEIDLEELIAHDCRLLNVFPALDSDGKITLRHLRLPTGTSAGDFEIGEAETLVSDQPPTWERNAIYGSINQVKIKTFYSVTEEEHTGTTYVVRDVTAQSVRKAPRELEIAPVSSERVRDPRVWDYDLAVGVARRVLGLFGRPYSIVRVQVPHTLLTTALCGTVAVFTSDRVPDPLDGTRGVTRKGGLVIGRSWDLSTETGTLTLMVADTPIAGYAPSAFVSSSALVSGDTYDLTVTFTEPGSGESTAPSGAVLSDFYSVGDQLYLVIWDATTQSAQSCVVDAVTDAGSTLRVTFGAAPTLTGTRYLMFANYSDGTLTDSQKRFAFFADAAAELDDGLGGFDPAKEYSG